MLLEKVYTMMLAKNAKIVSFTAPPASGKTHVIALCASDLRDRGISTCIVAPCSEVKCDFTAELEEVYSNASTMLPVYTTGAYRKIKYRFDFVFVDEAHNLRSAIELDRDVVKSIHLERGDPLFDYVRRGFEKTGRYTTKELSMEQASDILRRIQNIEYRKEAGYLLRSLSQWRSFGTIFDDACDLKFLSADPQKRSLMPNGRLFLFSATSLSKDELEFYCGIPKTSVRTVRMATKGFAPKNNISYYAVKCKSDIEKKKFIISILRTFKTPTLILLNNNTACLEWKKDLAETLEHRVVAINSGLDYETRLRIYKQFVRRPDQVLLTSSSAFWEGITIKNLKLLIIPNMPFPQPTLLDIAKRRHTEYREIARRRLVQGIGRIGRVPGEKGFCLLLFSPPKVNHSFTVKSKNQVEVSISGRGLFGPTS
jgi:hypothetical protein